ncbi:tetratricopeptide repeat protein [Flavobacterium sp.]|uniref:tetratricopeptide repeat protein n=1 Tax=Flavobacterium sp. TaxID=239 RepID=UPI00286E58F3|nr:tetratricopeptide repeat protein [Flavobacterium sp.]
MKNFFTYLFLWISSIVFSQPVYNIINPSSPETPKTNVPANEQLAQNYFDRGEFDKAIIMYEQLAKNQPNNYQYFQRQITCYQQLAQFEKAENLIKVRIERTKQPNLYVELGYNFQLQKNTDKANKNYQIAIDKIKENPNNVYSIARDFEQKNLIPQAIEAYNLGVLGNPNANFDYQIALLQGQLGKMDLMIDKLLDYAFSYPSNLVQVQYQLTRFITEDSQKTFSELVKKALLLRTQKAQDIFWNQFMSWFFVQQKDYGKAFIQEKAIFKRNPEYFVNIVNLSRLAVEEKEDDTARMILEYILGNTQDQQLLVESNYNLLNLDIQKAKTPEYPIIYQKIEVLLLQFGISPYTLNLQITKAHFESFYLKQFEAAKTTLNKALELPLNNYQKAAVKMELADVLLLDQKFNQAIIYYAQIEEDLKNDEVAHEASFKMAKASYFKGDFEWAQQQFKVLKSSTSQLISNDSMELFLLISDNTVEDSTQVALKKFSKADFLAYQNKNLDALQQFKAILEQHKTESIEDETLLKIGQLYQKENDYVQALQYYQIIIDKHSEGIYIDEALFFSAEIYRKNLLDNEKAKSHYEKIIFKHEDSIYFVEARNSFRKLRGDTNL